MGRLGYTPRKPIGATRLQVVEYLTHDDRSPFQEWLASLDRTLQRRVRTRLARLRAGNFGRCEDLKGGLWELKDPFGPGLRIYLGKAGDELVILLGGGTKRRQHHCINKARKLWEAYKDE